MATGISVTLGDPGTLDASFSGDGKVVTSLGGQYDVAIAVEVQPDGRIVLAGGAGDPSSFGLVRYNENGTLDTSFGSGGKVVTAFTADNDAAFGLALQPDGKILAAGLSAGATITTALARYGAGGVLDTTFGSGGKLSTDLATGDDAFSDVAVQADGKIVVVGVAGDAADFALLRYTSTGAPDTSFGSNGMVITPIGSGDDEAFSVLVQPDGKIVAAGVSATGSAFDFALARYTASGTLDTGFGSGGKVVTPIGAGADYGLSVALQADGKILVAGTSWNGSNYDFALARYDASGTLDAGFGSGGKVVTPIGAGDDWGWSVAVQANGRILVSGTTYAGASGDSDGDFAVACYRADGTLDAGFGTGGILVTGIGAGSDAGVGLALQPDGRVVVAGTSWNGTDNDFAALRLYGSTNRLAGSGNDDTLTGAAGEDTLLGRGGNDRLSGRAGPDALKGEAGADRLYGGKGNDKLTGGAGADKFVVDTALNATSNKDTILDFQHLTDKIWLDDDIFKKLGQESVVRDLLPGRFKVLNASAELDGNDFILYKKASGELFYDTNGVDPGGRTLFAVLGTDTHPALTYADFQVIA